MFVHLLFLIATANGEQIAGKIATNPACRDDVTRLCGDQVLPNDLAVLDCMQNSQSNVEINKDCHSVITLNHNIITLNKIFNVSMLKSVIAVPLAVSLAVQGKILKTNQLIRPFFRVYLNL